MKLKFPLQGLAPFLSRASAGGSSASRFLRIQNYYCPGPFSEVFPPFQDPSHFGEVSEYPYFIHIWFTGWERGGNLIQQGVRPAGPLDKNVSHGREARARDADPSPSTQLASWLPFTASAPSPLEWDCVIRYFKIHILMQYNACSSQGKYFFRNITGEGKTWRKR